jgi:hypothetical protein
VRRAVEITSREVVLEPVAPSFHARDVLAPAAAHLAAGAELSRLGPAADAAGLATLDVPEPEVEPGRIQCEVIDLNRFGNVQLDVRQVHLEAAGLDSSTEMLIEGLAGSAKARRVTTYADLEPGEYGAIVDPRGWLAVVRGNPENAAEGLGLDTGDLVWIREVTA